MTLTQFEAIASFVPSSSNPNDDLRRMYDLFEEFVPHMSLASLVSPETAQDIWEIVVGIFATKFDSPLAYIEAGQLLSMRETDISSSGELLFAREEVLMIVLAAKELFMQHYAEHCENSRRDHTIANIHRRSNV